MVFSILCPVCGENNLGSFRIFYDYEQKLLRCSTCSHVFRLIDKIERYHDFGTPEKSQLLESSILRKEYYRYIYQKALAVAGIDISKFLDIGSGNGYFMHLLHNWGVNEVTGVEPVPGIAEIVRKEYGYEIINDYYRKDLFEPDTFDMIYSNHVLEHVEHPNEFISSCWYHLKDNGLLIIEVPSSKSVEFFLYKITKIRKFVSGTPNSIINPQHYQYFTPESILHLLKKNNFNLITLETGNWQYKRPRYGWIFKYTVDPILNYLKIQSILVFARKESLKK